MGAVSDLRPEEPRAQTSYNANDFGGAEPDSTSSECAHDSSGALNSAARQQTLGDRDRIVFCEQYVSNNRPRGADGNVHVKSRLVCPHPMPTQNQAGNAKLRSICIPNDGSW